MFWACFGLSVAGGFVELVSWLVDERFSESIDISSSSILVMMRKVVSFTRGLNKRDLYDMDRNSLRSGVLIM